MPITEAGNEGVLMGPYVREQGGQSFGTSFLYDRSIGLVRDYSYFRGGNRHPLSEFYDNFVDH